jgi:hypothetical protein
MNYSLPKGYAIAPKTITLRKRDGNITTDVVELTNKRRKLTKVFANENFAIKYIIELESAKVAAKALGAKASSPTNFSISTTAKDIAAANELGGIWEDMTSEEVAAMNKIGKK